MSTFFMVLHLFTCVILVFVVLIQSGKEGGLGSMAGGGSSQTVFGSSGGANFFTKFTSILAGIFMVTSIILTVAKGGKKASIFDTAPANAATTTSSPITPEAKQAIPPTTATQPDAQAVPPATAPKTAR